MDTPSNRLEGRVPWAAAMESMVVPMVNYWIDRLGIRDSGAYDFYRARAERQTIFGEYELALAKRVVDGPLKFSEIHEVGCGLGQLVFLLGWNGIPTVGFEADALRASRARDLLRVLRVVDPEKAANIQLYEGLFPSDSAPIAGSNSLVVATNLVYTLTEEQQAAIIRAMRTYSYALVDIQRLFVSRDSQDKQNEVLALFEKEGFSAPEVFLDLGSDGKYMLFGNGT